MIFQREVYLGLARDDLTIVEAKLLPNENLIIVYSKTNTQNVKFISSSNRLTIKTM